MSDEEKQELETSIAANGLLEPIKVLPDGYRDDLGLWSGAIIDGAERYWACLMAGVDPTFAVFDPGARPLEDCVREWACTRRHLQKGQIATTISLLANHKLRHKQIATPQRERAAEAGVSRATMARADRVVREAPALAKQVIAGHVTLEEAHTIIAETPRPPLEVDRYGTAIPKEIQHCFSKEYMRPGRAARAYSIRARSAYESMLGDPHEGIDNHPLSFHMDHISIRNAFATLNQEFKQSNWAPYCVCPVCGGDAAVLKSACGGTKAWCRGQGWVTENALKLIPHGLRVSTLSESEKMAHELRSLTP